MAKTKQPQPPEDAEKPTFEEALEMLEAVVEQLEEGKLGLSEALVQYEQGVKHLKQCYQLLERAERRIELLAGVDAEGNAIAEPFEEASMSLDEKQRARGQRRTGRSVADEAAGEADGGVDRQAGLF